MRYILSLTPFVLGSCAASAFDRAPLTCETDSGTVRGYAAEDIAEVGRLVRDLSPRVRVILRPERAEHVRLVVMRSPVDSYAQAYTQELVQEGRMVDRFIVVGSERQHLRGFMVAHELVHWYMDGAWDRLPLALEEGLADLIASQLDPLGERAKLYDLARVAPAESFSEIESALRISRESWAGLTPDERNRVYRTGFIVARRIGVEGLRELCEEVDGDGMHSVLMDRVLGRCELGTDVRAWNEALRN